MIRILLIVQVLLRQIVDHLFVLIAHNFHSRMLHTSNSLEQELHINFSFYEELCFGYQMDYSTRHCMSITDRTRLTGQLNYYIVSELVIMNFILLKKIHTKIITRIEELQSLILLSLVYIFGIGTTALIGKMFRTTFVPTVSTAKGSWIHKKTPETNVKMY